MMQSLKSHSREELVWVIEQLWHEPGCAQPVERAMETLERRKAITRQREIRRLNAISDAARREYAQLMQPYAADPSRKLPPEVEAQAQAILDRADAADAQWKKLLGLRN